MTQPYAGPTMRPGEPGYDEARRVFNGLVDRHPASIMRPRSSNEVAAAVRAAVDAGSLVSVYGGGHGVTGSAVVDGGVCIDLRGLDRVEVDPDARTARVGGGATWGEVDAATQEHGLAVTGGRVSTTGVGGLTLGSGSGWLERKFGLHLRQPARGRGRHRRRPGRHRARQDREPRPVLGAAGGGGNFGIVTEFTFRLHEVGPIVLGGMLIYPGHHGPGGDAVLARLHADAPDEVGPRRRADHRAAGRLRARAGPWPAGASASSCCYAGDLDEGERVLAPLREFGPPGGRHGAADALRRGPAADRRGEPAGMHNYWTADFLAELPDEAIDTLVAHAQPARCRR